MKTVRPNLLSPEAQRRIARQLAENHPGSVVRFGETTEGARK